MFGFVKLFIKYILGRASLLERFSLILIISRYILPEYRFKWPQMDWWNDNDFLNYVEKFDGKYSNNQDRRWMSFQMMKLVENIKGDTAECGVYEGATSKLILKMNENSKYDKTHHIFDSFEGLSQPKEEDGTHWKVNALSIGENIVIDNLKPYKRFILYKGWIPTRFNEVDNKIFSFVHVDVDLYEPTRDSIEFFYSRMEEGAVFLCDDYGFTSCPGATKAIDEFLANKDEKMISLSGGAGFFIKGKFVSKYKQFKDY